MLRTLICACALLASAPTAFAEDFPRSAVGLDVVGDDGTVIGHVSGVQRNSEGRVVAVSSNDLEAPASAPANRPPVAAPQRQDRLPAYHPRALVAMADQNDEARARRD